MALVADGFDLIVNLVDSGGNGTTRTYNLTSADADAAATDAGAVMTALDAITDAVIAGYTLGERFIENALVYPTDAEVENNARITAKIVGRPNRSATIDIPAPNIGIFTGTTGPARNVVDLADTALQTFLQLFDGSGPITVSDGESIIVTSAVGKRIHKRSVKG